MDTSPNITNNKHVTQKRNKRRELVFFLLKSLLPITAGLLLFLFVIAILTYLYFANTLGSTEKILNNNNTGIVLLDRDNRPFFSFNQGKYEKYIPLSQISPDLQHAVIAAEDKNFYHEPGFSIRGIIRAAILDIGKKELAYGGSTLTQQLVKNELLTQQRTFLRKYQELILAEEMERRYSKNKILEMYLNSTYFGEGAFGAQEAAQAYFSKDAKDLDLAQSSLLAGILNSPSSLDPVTAGLSGAKARQSYVLDQMVESGYISQNEAQQAKNERIVLQPQPSEINRYAPHFALMVEDELIQKYGEERALRSGFKVKTSLDLPLQQYAENSVKTHVAELAGDNVSNGAAVVMDPKTGEVLALVGSADWNNPDFGKVNITTSLRQPGSSFKPIVYATALENRAITSASVLNDSKTTFPGNYTPHDYDNQYWGKMLPRVALSNSRNIPAVEVLQMTGIPQVLQKAQDFGITTLGDPSDYGLSLALGAGEVQLLQLTDAYTTFANGGQRNSVTLILSITDKSGHTIYTYEPDPVTVIDPAVAYIIASILSDAKARAREFGSVLNISRPAAVKTGTTENFRDAWTMGFTPQVTIGVWVGNNDGALMDSVAGSLGAAPIWRDLMTEYLSDKPIENFTKPNGIVAYPICTSQGLIARDTSTSSASLEYFINGTQPTQYCNPTSPSATPSATESPSPTPSDTPTPTTNSSQNGENNGNNNTQNDNGVIHLNPPPNFLNH